MRTQRTSVTTTPRTFLAALACLTVSGQRPYAQEPLTLRDVGLFYVGGEVREHGRIRAARGPGPGALPGARNRPAESAGGDVSGPRACLRTFTCPRPTAGRDGPRPSRGVGSAPTSTIPSTRDRQGSPWDPSEAPMGRRPASIPGTSARYGAGGDSAMRLDEPYPEARFPTDHMDQFYASWPPRVGGGGGGMGGAAGGGMGGAAAVVAVRHGGSRGWRRCHGRRRYGHGRWRRGRCRRPGGRRRVASRGIGQPQCAGAGGNCCSAPVLRF